jgi:hypothetical protein
VRLVFSLSQLERDIARRSRALRGLRAAGIAFAAAVGVVLAASVAIRFGAFAPRLALSLGALLFVGLAALVGYLVGRARRPSIPRLLLSIDLALATGERLGSLHELRSRGTAVPLQKRIEEILTQAPPAWRRVLRIRQTEVLPWVAGGVALALAIFLAVTISPPVPATAADPGERSRISSKGTAVSPSDSGEAAADGAAAGRLDPGQSEPALPLVDTLAEILLAPPSRGLLSALTDEEVAQGSRSARDPREALSELLSQLMSRAQIDPRQSFALTEREKTALRDLLQDLPSSGLRQSLTSLLSGETGDALKDQIADSKRLLDSLNQSAEGEGNAQVDSAPEDQEADVSEDGSGSIGWSPPATSSEGNTGSAEGGEQQSGTKLEGPGTEDELAPPLNDEGGTAAGRTGPGEGSASPPGVGFVPEDLLGSLGAGGEMRRFFTKGIPFEPPAAERGPAAVLSLDYETLRALLEARTLAPGVQALVRTYFEKITQGGP